MNRILLCATLGMAACMGACAQQPSGQSTPLFDDEGRPAANVPAAIPASPAHRTRAGLYITEAQARAHEQTLPGGAISVFAGCCGDRGLDDAMVSAWAQHASLDAPSDMPVLVRGIAAMTRISSGSHHLATKPTMCSRSDASSSCVTPSASVTNSAMSDDCVSRATQLRLDAALRITLIWCQRPGRQWQKACTPWPGLGAKPSLPANSTPEVPSDSRPAPASTTPRPTAAAALSPAPPASNTACAMPHSWHSDGRICAAAWLPSTRRGMCSRERLVAASMRSDQSRLATSSHRVPEASDMSETQSPVRRSAT